MATTTDHALATTEQQTSELQVSAQQAMSRQEIEGAIVVAQRFPRNEDNAFQGVMAACKRFAFADKARYSYKRGGKPVEGGSVHLARETARHWGNIRYGLDIIQDDEDTRTVRGWAWDVQTNTRTSEDAKLKKLILRKDASGGTHWIKPDERDMRELSNNIGARCVRNCLLNLFPRDLIDDAVTLSNKIVKARVDKDVDEHRKAILLTFSEIGVSAKDLEAFLGHPLRQATAEDITTLRGIYRSIRDEGATWFDYAASKSQPPQQEGGATADDLTKARDKPIDAESTRPAEAAPPTSNTPTEKVDQAANTTSAVPAGRQAEAPPEAEPAADQISDAAHKLMAEAQTATIGRAEEIIKQVGHDAIWSMDERRQIREAAEKRIETRRAQLKGTTDLPTGEAGGQTEMFKP